MRRAAALLLLSLALGAPACAYGRRVQAPYRVPGVLTGPVAPDRGRFLYQRDCSWCHGPRGEGTVRAPDLVTDANGTAMTDFMLSTGRMPLDFPRQRATRRPPAYGRKDIAAIVGYVATFGQAGSNI